MGEKLRYRTERQPEAGGVEDVFDSEYYAHLRRTRVVIGDETLPHKFFELLTDIAMGISTDGFGVFKRRGGPSCWPLIGFLYNLPPEIRFHLVHVISFGIIGK